MTTYKEMQEKINMNESVNDLSKAYLKVRQVYQSGKRYTAREWIKFMADLLDDID